jgi:methionyl-tRNA synthetase
MNISKEQLLITAALPYVNNKPHLGNIIGCVLSADSFSRFSRLMNKNILFVGGTDEYGTATETTAREQGITPRELCNINFEEHKKIYEWFNISFDCFGRTSTNDPSNESWAQTEITWDIYKKLVENGYVESKKERCLFCEEINSFVSDRFVVGQCYLCGYNKANGDQCDECSKLLEATKLINPIYKLNSDYKLIEKETEHLYFTLPYFTDELRKLLDNNSDKWSHNAVATTNALLKSGLIDRSISRDLKWGTPVPDTKKFGDKFKHKVFYVWFDAPIGYISITKNSIGEDYVKWWKNPNNVELVQFMAKDNIQFHSIIFPGTLMATKNDYTLVSRISSTEYLQYGNKKFSKSKNIGVFGDNVMELDFPADYWRYYLLSIRPESKDSKFTWEGFISSINESLFANFGNLVSRVINISFKGYNNLQISSVKWDSDIDFNKNQELCILNVCEAIKEYVISFSDIKIVESIRLAQKAASVLNEYITKTKPWKLLKSSSSIIICNELTFLNFMLNKIISVYSPFVPGVCHTIKQMIGSEYDINCKLAIYESSFNIPTTKPLQLFKLIDVNRIKEFKDRFGDPEN